MTTLIVIAKEPVPGRVKTRLTPTLSYEQAAAVAAASIADTVATANSVPATRRVLAFDGINAPRGTEGWDVIHQVDGTLDLRLGAIFDECEGPALLIGMDTPQVRAHHLAEAFTAWPSDVDAWFGPATDGGFWALGLAHPDGDLIRGVPMSQDDTGLKQLARLHDAGLRVRLLPPLTDVDTIENAREVARLVPGGHFAATLGAFVRTGVAA